MEPEELQEAAGAGGSVEAKQQVVFVAAASPLAAVAATTAPQGTGSGGGVQVQLEVEDQEALRELMELAGRAWNMIEVRLRGVLQRRMDRGNTKYRRDVLKLIAGLGLRADVQQEGLTFEGSSLQEGLKFLDGLSHSPPHLKVDQREVEKQDADRAEAERQRREEVERQKKERQRLEQVWECVQRKYIWRVIYGRYGPRI